MTANRSPGAPTKAVSGSSGWAPCAVTLPISTEAIIPGLHSRSSFGISTSTSKLRVTGLAAAAMRLTRAANVRPGRASVVTATGWPSVTDRSATSGRPSTTLTVLTSPRTKAGVPGAMNEPSSICFSSTSPSTGATSAVSRSATRASSSAASAAASSASVASRWAVADSISGFVMLWVAKSRVARSKSSRDFSFAARAAATCPIT